LGKTDLSRDKLCNDPGVTKDVLKTLASFGTSMKLERFEVPKAVRYKASTKNKANCFRDYEIRSVFGLASRDLES
jgi:hypothetical protein